MPNVSRQGVLMQRSSSNPTLSRSLQVGTIKEAGEDKPELFSFFCGPTGYDKVSSPAPCAAWIMKAVVDDTDSEDDFNASFKAAKTPLCFKHDTHSLTATSTPRA